MNILGFGRYFSQGLVTNLAGRFPSRISIVCVFFLLSLIVIAPASGNPALIQGKIQSGVLDNNYAITMPYANVWANITRNETAIIVQQEGNYSICSPFDQNATLAFVYPNLVYDVVFADMSIILNEEALDFHINDSLSSSSIYWGFDPVMCDYAVFDVELEIGVSYNLFVNTTTILSLDDIQTFAYQYIVASARSFNGSTLETITLDIYGSPPFVTERFWPEENLTLSTVEDHTRAVWNLNVSEMDASFVLFGGDLVSRSPVLSPTDLLIVAGGAGAILISAYVLIRRR